MRRCVWSRNLVNEEALVHWGLSRQKRERYCSKFPYVTLHILRQWAGRQTILYQWYQELSKFDLLLISSCLHFDLSASFPNICRNCKEGTLNCIVIHSLYISLHCLIEIKAYGTKVCLRGFHITYYYKLRGMSLWPLVSLFLCPHYFAELARGRVIHRNGVRLRHTGSPVGTSHLHLQFQEMRDISRATRTSEVTQRWSPWLPQVDTYAALWRFRQPSFHSRGFPPISHL